MIKTAVIVAAGLGSRMVERTVDRPKGFLEIGGVSIIEQSIHKLIEAGMERIVIGTGYLSEQYERLSDKYPQVMCVRNEHYLSTGSMYTLSLLKAQIKEPFILLESDLIYEKKALRTLLEHTMPDVILGSSLTQSGDEVFIETDEQGSLITMDKGPLAAKRAVAELVGITKLTLSTFQRMCMFAEQAYGRQPLLHYEEALTGIAKDVRLHVHKINDLAWCEIDDEQHWKRAVEEIYPVIEARDRVLMAVARNILLNPGPATTSDTVKYAQIVPDICPREQEFGNVMIYIADELTRLAADPKAYTTVLFGGSGTAAVESILSSVTGKEDVMIINNGAYGERMCRIADIYGLNYRVFVSPVDEPIDPEALEAFIRSGGHSPESATQTLPNPSHLAIVHCETTTGLLNDIEEVGKLCAKYGTRMIVDAVSSFAAVPIDMNRMNISYLAASANKNLQGMAGVSFVIAHQDHLESTKRLLPRSLYLHLYDQYQHFQKTGQMRFTPPVQTLYALKQAIIETKREGITNRYNRYIRSWRTLIEGLQHLGLKHLVSEEHHSKIITSIVEPSNKHYRFNDMHDYFYKRGYTIYPGKLDRLNTFRVANIGDLTYIDLERFLAIFEQYLNSLGR